MANYFGKINNNYLEGFREIHKNIFLLNICNNAFIFQYIIYLLTF
jgi:hypothetical protein